MAFIFVFFAVCDALNVTRFGVFCIHSQNIENSRNISSPAHLGVNPNLFDLLSFVEHKRGLFA